MKSKTKNLNIIKVPNNLNYEMNFELDFEEFDDLFLSRVENVKKLKIHKRNVKFDYHKFHEKERNRILNRDNGIITTCKSPPESIKSIINKNKSKKNNTEHDSSSSGYSEVPLVFKSPEVAKMTIESYRSITSPIQSLHSTHIGNNSDWNNDIIIYKSRRAKKTPQTHSVHEPVSPPYIIKSVTRDVKVIQTPLIHDPLRGCENHKRTSCVDYRNSSARSASVPEADDSLKRTPCVKTIQPSKLNQIPATKSSFNSHFSKASSFSNAPSKSSKIQIKQNSLHKYLNNSFKSDVISSVHKVSSLSSLTESDDDEKRELLFKFQILATKYPHLVSKYPFTMRSDLKVIKSTYTLILKQIAVNNKVDNLNTYLLAGFMMCEYLLGKLGFDMEGFSKQQISSMKNYESLLIELGEKEYKLYGMDKWSVEVRLAATLMFNAFWFIIAKSISKKTNFDILGMISIVKSSKDENEDKDKPILLNTNVVSKKMKGLRDISSS